MEFLDKLTKKASETYKGAAEKTSKIAREAKLKIKINENKSKINDLYEQMGMKVYEKYSTLEEMNIKEELKEECEQIDVLSAEIQNYHEEILSLSDIKVCGNCKENMDKDAKYCPQCGTKQPEIEEVKEPEVTVEPEEEQEEQEEQAQNEESENENKSDEN